MGPDQGKSVGISKRKKTMRHHFFPFSLSLRWNCVENILSLLLCCGNNGGTFSLACFNPKHVFVLTPTKRFFPPFSLSMEISLHLSFHDWYHFCLWPEVWFPWPQLLPSWSLRIHSVMFRDIAVKSRKLPFIFSVHKAVYLSTYCLSKSKEMSNNPFQIYH